MATLKIGSTYNFYSKYSTIVSKIVKVAAQLTFTECSKYSYDITTLAINERVISVKDEDLEGEIGSDNIYLLREINKNVDGSYNEYIVWDSIIDYNKTSILNESYTGNITFKIKNTVNYNISQIIQAVNESVRNMFGNNVEFEISNVIPNSVSAKASSSQNMNTILTDDTLNRAEKIVNTITSFENKLLPAANTIINSQIDSKLATISENVMTISSQIALIKRGL